ncbi:hypothetical protein Val02_77080 [Virgisporangium aliadipatigenens]|uniref:Protein kinase domain-containing protein n=1 Tax=Virgisporangium aliadipatigenens TaxID=741659 RepID=A0A8J3YUC9_9ACTN|nr:protein kinase family protein [Virgisporangium aliadipatigenens]GIJ50822.1 hypothetical protein Val02_77080 [Virgisporangium aliadipatigenens]
MTPIDEDPQSAGANPQVLTVGAPEVGEVLAERYRLEEHIGNDSLGRQLWRGADVILQRQVTVVLRYPGGDSAAEMLSAAVAASRIVHPHLVGVYDAIDEGERAYVVREWVQGTSLRDVVAEYGPLEADKVVAIGHAVADAVAALHDTGMAHGNVQPGTVLIGDDGRVVLADARADESATVEADLRAIGAVLYCSLTGHWPHAEAGVSVVPDAVRDDAGTVIAPSQARAGVPGHLDELTVDLLNAHLNPPSAEILSAELGRLDNAEDQRALFADEAEIGLDSFDNTSIAPEAPERDNRRLAVIIAAVLAVVVLGGAIIIGTSGDDDPGTKTPAAVGTGSAVPGKGPTGEAGFLPLKADQLRIVDPQGDGSEQDKYELAVDGNPATAWNTDRYQREDFGGLKKGVGILVDLGADTSVSAVDLELGNANTDIELYGGPASAGAAGDKSQDSNITKTLQQIGPPKPGAGSRTIMLVTDPTKKVRYVLVWFTRVPKEANGGGYRLLVSELKIRGQAA